MPPRAQKYALWTLLLLYAAARPTQLAAARLPMLLIVMLHVVPPALFALIHGAALYGRKGIAVFAALSLGIGSLAELVSLHTGFPFGHYVFTDVMGPKLFGLPVLLALAYLGIGYASWILALLILGRHAATPALAAFIMTSWDIAMDPVWSTYGRAWIWFEGGAWFGVPLSNYFGWFLTAFLYYQAFAFYCRAHRTPAPKLRAFWTPAILLYAVCAVGNILVLLMPNAPPVATDPVGHQWSTTGLFTASAFVSALLMLPFSAAAWWNLTRSSKGAQRLTPSPASPRLARDAGL